MKEKMTGVILAGGKSSRMGQEKALMAVAGVTVLKRVLGVFGKLFDEILIVTNRKGRFGEYGYPEIVDLIPDCGPLGGIYTGLHSAKSERIFVASCDLPFINTSSIALLMKEAGEYDIVVPDIEGRLHPLHAIYSKRCMPFILERLKNRRLDITGFINDAGKLSVKRVQAEELMNEDPDLISLFNMNTQEDWMAANEGVGSRLEVRSVGTDLQVCPKETRSKKIRKQAV